MQRRIFANAKISFLNLQSNTYSRNYVTTKQQKRNNCLKKPIDIISHIKNILYNIQSSTKNQIITLALESSQMFKRLYKKLKIKISKMETHIYVNI